MKKLLFGVIILFVCFLLAVPVTAADDQRVIVKFRPNAPPTLKQGGEALKLRDVYVLKGNLEALRKNPNIIYAEVDATATKLETPNDTSISNQWGLSKIKAFDAWNTTHGGNIDIAIVDTGINYTHPDLGSKIGLSINCTLSGCPAQTTTDPDGHGTHVAGIASAITNNGVGIAGISWDGRLMSIKTLDDNGSGYYSWIANGIIAAADAGAEVINLSLGGSLASYTLEQAINYAWNKGAVIVGASGNSGRNRAIYPAYYANVIAVAATDQNDNKASFSNYGTWVEVAAPGVSIYSTYGSSYTVLSGTSMATPFVSGLAGLLFGQNPSWTNTQVRNRIQSTADSVSGTGSYWAYGRINACNAVGCIVPSPASTPVATQTPSSTLNPTPTISSTPLATPTPTLILTPIPNITASPTPSSTAKPWWCRYVPTHSSCQ